MKTFTTTVDDQELLIGEIDHQRAEDRQLTYEERATFGTCPICFAEHGEWCDGDVGMALGLNVHGERPEHAVHLGRLNAAPKRKKVWYE